MLPFWSGLAPAISKQGSFEIGITSDLGAPWMKHDETELQEVSKVASMIELDIKKDVFRASLPCFAADIDG